jgi:hypothetical protein
MTAYRVIDDHKELGNIGTKTHDQLDEHVTNTPFVVLSVEGADVPASARILTAGTGITLTDGGATGAITISATAADGSVIGPAEDGSYEDGLFKDFTPSTPIGTPIDRFNEILLALAPPPAPNLRNANCENSSGVTAYLSFGASNDRGGYLPSYVSSNTAAGFSAVDVNGSYAPATSGDNIRKGIYKKDTIINGILNNNVSSNVFNTGVVNYVSKAFGNGDTGELRLYVNNTLIHSINLSSAGIGAGSPGAGTGTHLNANGSGFINLSSAGSAYLSTSVEFPAFKHRTGKYQIGVADQRRGWNYARVVHVVGATQYQTNYVEWINDDDSSTLQASGGSLSFTGDGSTKLSGVEYYNAASLSYNVKIYNHYKYVYDLSNVTLTATNTSNAASNLYYSFPSQSKSTIDISAGENHTKVLNVSSQSNLIADYFLNGSVEVGVNVSHPLKASIVNGGRYSVSQILIYKLTNTSSNLIETFRAENYRLKAGSYDTQAAVADSANSWDSSIHMLSTAGYSDGLQFYNQLLVSPKNTVNGGNFLGMSHGPSGNPNYSTITGTRTFYRKFLNSTGVSQYDLSLSLNGSSTIVDSSTSLNASRIKLSVKIPGKTGWMDVALPYVFGASYGDGSGLHTSNGILSFNSSLSAINYLNLGNLSIDSNEYIVVKIEADATWTGNVSLMSVTFGAGTGTLTPVPDLYNIDSDNIGSSAVLSFGSTKSIASYTNPDTNAGFSATGLNEVYGVATSGNNLRRGIFTTIPTMEGDLNEAVASPGRDYVDNAFSDGNIGVLRLEVNGSTVHSIDLSSYAGVGSPGAGSGTSVNGNGSGFISVSTWSPGMFDNGVPRYSEIQRTGRYRVVPAEQQNGWNYLRVVHSVDAIDRVTNYVEWVNEVDSTSMSSSENSLSIFGDDSFSYVSGVKYFNSPSGSIHTKISNIYRNVYTSSATAISFTSLTNASAAKIVQSGTGITSTKVTNSSAASLQTLNTNTDSQNEDTEVVGTINFTPSKSLPGSRTTSYGCGGAMTFVHPFKASVTTPVQSTTKLLVWTPSNASSNESTECYFTGEIYRIVDTTYATQSVVVASGNAWDSTVSINDPTNNPGHATGLLIYDRFLMAPKYGGEGGDFRNHKEGGSIESPSGNVDYSTLVNSTRTYLRYFRNNTTDDRPSIKVTLYGDATLVAKNGPNAGSLGANKNIQVHVCVPGKTGFMDLARPSAGSGNWSDDSGCLSGDLISSIGAGGAQNTCTFNGVTANGTASPSAQRVIVRITAHKDWTGYLERISISWS